MFWTLHDFYLTLGARHIIFSKKLVKEIKMAKVIRFGVSLETDLLEKFDSLIKKNGYKSRSEAIRDLIRERLVSEEWKEEEKETVGILCLVFSHEKRELTETLTKLQHKYFNLIISSTHIHLDKHNCLEVIVLRGKSHLIKKISDEIVSTRSVKHGKLLMTSTGRDIA